MNKKFVFIFLLILAVAVFLRIYRIADIPPGVNRDEASIGYTAYSILHTGRDEYGRLFPISFQSFGDWKLPLYIYLTVATVAIFGLSEFAVRFPSAIFGILSVVGTYFLVQLLFKNKVLSLLAMLLMAISPWSLHLSRVESESNTAVFLTILAVIFFLKSLKDKPWMMIPSSILFALTYFTYAGNHIFTTLLVLGLVFIYRNQLKKTRLNLLALLIFLSLCGFIFYHTLFEANRTKLSGVSIFGDPSIVFAKIVLAREEHKDVNSFFAKIVHNKIELGIEKFLQNYLNSFSPQFLFQKGGENHAHNILNFGNMYLVEAPFLFLGLIYLIAIKKGRERNLVLLWIFIAPIAVSITKDAPHTNRMFAIFPILPLVTSMGFYWLIVEVIKKRIFKKVAVIFTFSFLIFNFLLYIDRYFFHFPQNEEQHWGIGYKRLYDYISQKGLENNLVIMNKPEWSPYIYFLFYSKYDPLTYQKTAIRYKPTDDGFVHVKKYDRFEFRKIDWDKDIFLPKHLLIDVPNKNTEIIRRKKEYEERYSETIVNKYYRMFVIVNTL